MASEKWGWAALEAYMYVTKTLYRVPAEHELPDRLESVLTVIYLVFNEGYLSAGAESLTQIQQAEAIGKVIGRPVRFEELSPGQFRQVATQHFPAPVVEDLLKALASYVGQTAYMTADLEKIIGRPATSYAQWAVQNADAYR